MLRINLLPPYIYEGKNKGKFVGLWVFILILVVGGLLAFKASIDSATTKINEETAARESDATKADDYAKKASDTNAKSAVVRGKADFVTKAKEYDTQTYQAVLTNVAQYTWPKVVYSGINASGQTVEMPAFAPSLADVGHYIMYMERNPKISRVDIGMNSIPGFPSEGSPQSIDGLRPAGHDFQVTLALVSPIAGGPTYPGGGGASAGGGNPLGGGAGGGAGSSGGNMMMGGGGAGASGGGAAGPGKEK